MSTASSRDRLEAALARIADPKGEGARACLTVYTQAARDAADAADARAKAGISLGPLDGAIVSIKDLFDVAGEVTRAGSKVLAEEGKPAAQDAPPVRRLRAGGAVIVAKTNMTEFAYSGIGANPHYGTPGNPADRQRVPGGSSSGAAVAAADGLCEVAIGTDTGGSTRIPAAFCGIVGFKPSRERIPTDGAFPLSYSIDSIGPLARTVEACAKADAVMAGDDWVPLEPAPLANLRVGIAQGPVLENLDATVGKSFPRAIDALEKAGCRLSNEKLPLLDDMARVNAKGGVQPAEAFAIHRDLLGRRADDIDPNVRARLERARNIGAADYHRHGARARRADPRHGCAARRRRRDGLADHAHRRADHGRSGHAGGLRAQERDGAAQHGDRQLLQSLRHLAAAAARGRPAHRADAGRAQRPRPPAVPHRRGGGEIVHELTSELPQHFQQRLMPLAAELLF